MKKPSNGVQAGGDGFWDDFGAKDFEPPLVSIGQPSSAKKVAGEFNFNTGKHTPVLKHVKLLVPRKGRVLFSDNKAACASDNSHVPSARIQNPVSPSCEGCFAAQWGDSDPRKSALYRKLGLSFGEEKPLCAETYNLIMVDENMSPFIISFYKAQLEPVKKKLFSKLRFEFGHVEPWQVAFDMSLEKGTGKGNYYVVRFDHFMVVDEDEKERLEVLYRSMSSRANNIIGEQFEKADEEARSQEASSQAPPWKDEETPQFSADDEIPF